MTNKNKEDILKYQNQIIKDLSNLAGIFFDDFNYSLIGIGTKESMDLRRKALEEIEKVKKKDRQQFNAYKDGILESLAGIDTQEAMQMRKEILQKEGFRRGFSHQGVRMHALFNSLIGVYTKEAMDFRKELLDQADENEEEAGWYYASLAFNASKEAMKIRKQSLKEGVHPGWILRSLMGVDSDEAIKMRRELIKNKDIQEREQGSSFMMESLLGVDSKEANEIREEYYKKDPEDEQLPNNLTGLSSKRADKFREEMFSKKIEEFGYLFKNSVLAGSAGVETETTMRIRRESLEGVNRQRVVAESLCGLYSEEIEKMRKICLEDRISPYITYSARTVVETMICKKDFRGINGFNF